MTDQNAAGRLRCFLAAEQAGGAPDDHSPLFDDEDLTYGDLRALLDEHRELAEKLAAATRTVAAVASQQPQDDPQPPQERLTSPSATDEPDEHQFEPQQPAGDVEPTHYGPGVMGEPTTHLGNRTNCPAPDCQDDPDEPLHADQLDGYRRALAAPPTHAHHTYYQIAWRLLREVERLEQELASAYADDEAEHPTLRDVDPGYVHDCEEADRIADKYYEPGPGHSEEAPF
jgi:hypothetical protein